MYWLAEEQKHIIKQSVASLLFSIRSVDLVYAEQRAKVSVSLCVGRWGESQKEDLPCH